MDNSAPGTADFPSAVPTYLTRFIGRDHETGVLTELLGDPAVRWITIAGPGGVGKSRLSVESIKRSRDEHGQAPLVYFVTLFGVTDPMIALYAIARSLDPTNTDVDPLVTISAAVSGRRLILLLDNADKLVPHGVVFSHLLTMSGCERVTILITSRQPFHRSGEHLLTLKPLETPEEAKMETAQLAASPSIRLFIDRARAARSDLVIGEEDLPTVATICRRMDGLPLTIELTALSLRQLSLKAVAERVRVSRFSLESTTAPHDLPGHTSLNHSIAASFDLLSATDRDFLLRLSVFPGGVSIESGKRMAAPYRAEDGYPHAVGYGLNAHGDGRIEDLGLSDAPALKAQKLDLEPLDLDPVSALERLHDFSLLQRTFDPDGETRYRFLETINEFALAELARTDQLERAYHARMITLMALLDAGNEGIWTAHKRVVPISRLDAELTNLRATIKWLLAKGEDAADLATRMADTVMAYFQMRGMFPEGIELLSAALANNPAALLRRVSGLTMLGFACWMTGDTDRAESVLDEAIALVDGTGAGSFEGRAHFYRALVAWRRGPDEIMRAVSHIQIANERFVSWDDGIGQGVCKLALGEVVRHSGDHTRAVQLFEAAYRHLEENAYAWGAATAQWFMGEAERAIGNEAGAARHLLQGLIGYQSVGDRLGMAGCVAGVAALLARRQEWALSAHLFGGASVLRERTQSILPPTHEAEHEAIATSVLQWIGQEAFQAGRNTDSQQIVNEAIRIATALARGASIHAVPLAHVKRRSSAQNQVLELVADGKNVKQIIQITGTGHSTVYRHIAALKAEFNCHSDAELMEKARKFLGRKD